MNLFMNTINPRKLSSIFGNNITYIPEERKSFIRQLRSFFLLLQVFAIPCFFVNQANAQCTTGCTNTITLTSNSNTISYSLKSNEIICIVKGSSVVGNATITTGTINVKNRPNVTLCFGPGVIVASGVSITNPNNQFTINNYGILQNSLSIGTNQATLNNYGTIAGPVTLNNGNINNMSGGTFSSSGFTMNGGSFTNNTSSSFNLSTGFTNSGGNFSGSGSFTVDGNLITNAGSTSIGGAANITGSVTTNTVTTFGSTLTVGGSFISNSGAISIAGATTITGALTTNTAFTASSNLTVGGNMQTNSGNFAVSGTTGIGGTTTINTSVSLAGAATLDGNVVINTGTTIFSSGANVTGTLTNSGTVNFTGSLTSTGAINNNGIITSSSGSCKTLCGSSITNNGTISSTAGPNMNVCVTPSAGTQTNLSLNSTPAANVGSLAASVSGSTVNGTFTAANPLPGGYVLLRKANAAFTDADLPVNNNSYSAGSTIGAATVVSLLANSAISFSDVPGCSTYFYAIVSASNYSATCATFRTASYASTGPIVVTIPTTISYVGSPWCTSAGTQAATQTGIAGGTYSSTIGLSISSTTGLITPSTSTAGTYVVTYAFAASGNCAAGTTTVSVTITAPPTISYTGSPWCVAASTQIVTGTGVAGGTYSSTTGLSINGTTGTITPSTSTAGTYTVSYAYPASGGCAAATTTTSVTIAATPSITSGTSTSICSGTALSFALTASSGAVFSWIAIDNTNTTGESTTAQTGATINNTIINNSNTTQNVVYAVTPTVSTGGDCVGTAQIVTVTVYPRPAVTAMISTVCSATGFTVSPVNSTNGIVPSGTTYSWLAPSVTGITGTVAASGASTISGTLTNTTNAAINVAYTVTPTAGSCVGPTFTVTVTVNPQPAVTAMTSAVCSGTGFSVTPANSINGIVPTATTYSWSAPSVTEINGTAAGSSASTISGTLTNTTNAAINLVYTVTPNSGSCSGAPFNVTVTVNPSPSVSAASTVCVGSTSIVSPTAGGTWVSNNTGLATVTNAGVVTGVATGSTTFTFTQTANSCTNTTSLVAVNRPAVTAPGSVCIGSTITLTPTTSGTWVSNNTALATVTDAGVVTAIATGSVTFTFTQTADGCSNTTGAVTVNALPTVVISPNYCVGGGLVRLTSNTQTSYLWSTGATTQSINVNVAGNYIVTATNAAGCVATDVQVVGAELVTNGDFSSGNTGFVSAYTFVGPPSQTALWPEGTYTVATNANGYHSNFWGNKDHTSGSGNFMIVNGSVNTLNIWQQTVTVQPNTNYYFSAWAYSINKVGPFADLRFRVNGTQVGTIQSLPAGPGSNTEAFAWYNFFGTWNSGSATSAVINIVNLEVAAGGNDFAIDDISFATLAPVNLVLAPASNTPVCTGSPLNLTANVSGGRSPYTYTWTGPSSYTSSTQNPTIVSAVASNAGVYTLSVTDGYGCSANANTAAMVINTSPASRSVTTSVTSICAGSSTNIQVLLSEVGVNYQLRNNTGNVNIGAVVAGTGGTVNLPTGTLNSNTTFNVLASSGTGICNTQMSSTANIIVNANGQWIGAATGEWNIAGNWCGGVPTASTNVTIPAATTVNIQSANAVANSVTIASTGSLVMAGTNNLSITAGGTFTNNGTFTATGSTGTVAFLGSGTISGIATFKNIDTYGALNFGTASTVSGTFSLQTGGSVTGNAPMYTCPSAVLLYKPGAVFTRGLEWTTASSGVGYPANVLVQNNTTINFPVSGNGYICYDLQIDAGSSLKQNFNSGSASLFVGRNVTINGTLELGTSNGGDITLGGNWTRNAGGVFNANDRKVTFDGIGNFSGNGLAMSTITAPAAAAKNNEGGFGGENFAHLWMNKSTPTDSVVLFSNITISREIGFTRGTFSLRNSDVTLVSNNTRTAGVAPIATLANVSIRYGGLGKFVVQRFVQNPTAVRSWRLMCAPLQITTAPSINEAWQQGVVNPDKNNPNANSNMYNPWPGYGTHISGPGGTYSAVNGFDQGTSTSSILQTSAGVSSWISPTSTISTKVTDRQGWMLFVRGDRGFAIGNQYVAAQNTTLEPKGRINIGNVTVPVAAGRQVIANPYPSAISLLNIDVTGTLGKLSSYYVWDPKFFTSYTQPGKWVSFTGIGNSFAKTTSQSAYSTGGIVESGQAFIVESLVAGSITFRESDKLSLISSLTGISNRPANLPDFSMFRTDLYVRNDSTYKLTDGVLNIFNSGYNNDANEDDTKKVISFNTRESLSIIRDSLKMAIEKRNDIQAADTIFYFTSRLNELPYRFRFEVTDFSSITGAFLEDRFTGIKTPINNSGVTEVDFTINTDNASKAENRFRVVFKNFLALPVKLLDFTANKERESNNIKLQWKVDNETDMAGYQIERSVNGINFTKIGYHVTYNSGSTVAIYNWADTKTLPGLNSYRLKMMDKDGKFTYSKIVAVKINAPEGNIKVYPNPVTDGNIKIHFAGMPKGRYHINLINAAGQIVLENNMELENENTIKEIMIGNAFPSGTYQLDISNNSNYRKNISVVIEK